MALGIGGRRCGRAPHKSENERNFRAGHAGETHIITRCIKVALYSFFLSFFFFYPSFPFSLARRRAFPRIEISLKSTLVAAAVKLLTRFSSRRRVTPVVGAGRIPGRAVRVRDLLSSTTTAAQETHCRRPRTRRDRNTVNRKHRAPAGRGDRGRRRKSRPRVVGGLFSFFY